MHNANVVTVQTGSKYAMVGSLTERQKALRMKMQKRVRGWVDMEWKLYNAYKLIGTDGPNQQLRSMYDSMFGGRSEVVMHDIMNFVHSMNPLVAARYYIFKRFAGLLYQVDLIQAVYLAMNFNMSRVLAHVIVMGLERHASKRKQRTFLKMVEATIARLTT